MRWYVSQHGNATGPFDEERLATLVRWGKISRDAFLCDERHSAWISIRSTAFAAELPAESRRRGAGASEWWARFVRSARAVFELGERNGQQALGLVALSLVLAGVLAVAL